MLTHSESVELLAAAMSLAQSEMGGALKVGVEKIPGRPDRYYATLESVIDAIKGPMTKNGITVSQFPGTAEGGKVPIITLVTHKSGQFFRHEFAMPIGQTTPQTVGSAITYGRRYALMAIFGIAPEDDDAREVEQTMPTQGKIPPAGTTKTIEPPKPPEELSDACKKFVKAWSASGVELTPSVISTIVGEKADRFWIGNTFCYWTFSDEQYKQLIAYCKRVHDSKKAEKETTQLRANFLAVELNCEWTPLIVQKILNLSSEELGADCFGEDGKIDVEKLGDGELKRLISYANTGIIPADNDTDPLYKLV